MTGQEMQEIRKQLRLDRVAFARLIGYTGTDRNDETRVKRLEHAEQVPLYIARLVWLISRQHRMTGSVPVFPDWAGYEYDHSPDPGHARAMFETKEEADEAADNGRNTGGKSYG